MIICVNNKKYFYKIEYYFKTLNNNYVIPTYKNYYTAIKENDTCNYYKYNEYVITNMVETNSIDKENFKPSYIVLQTYFGNKYEFNKDKKYFDKYKQNYNYIKEDILEQLIKKGLEKD